MLRTKKLNELEERKENICRHKVSDERIEKKFAERHMQKVEMKKFDIFFQMQIF
jgi:hypothetical protein